MMKRQNEDHVKSEGGSVPLGPDGFTLLEILVALVMGLVFFTAIGALIVDQTETHEDHQVKVMMQQNGRAALSILANDLMIAGYSPDSTGHVGITTAGIDGIAFDYINGNGAAERVGYSYVSDEDRFGRSFNGGNRQSLLRSVEAFRILYAYDAHDPGADEYGALEKDGAGDIYWAYDSDTDAVLDTYYTLNSDGSLRSTGTWQDGPSIDRIRAAKIWLLMRGNKRNNKRTVETLPGNIPGFSTAGLGTDNYSYRLYTTTVKFRNMYY